MPSIIGFGIRLHTSPRCPSTTSAADEVFDAFGLGANIAAVLFELGGFAFRENAVHLPVLLIDNQLVGLNGERALAQFDAASAVLHTHTSLVTAAYIAVLVQLVRRIV